MMYSVNNNNDRTMGQPFLSHENAQMIWELLQETDIYNNIGDQEKIEIRSQFTKNMREFNEKHTMSSLSLIERNKLFIGVVLNQHRRANIADAKKMKKTTSLSPSPSPIITLNKFPTSKEVQEERRQVFDNDLQRRRNEFNNSMSISKPEVPTFSDKMDEPISKMEDLVNQTIASRELEMNQIFNSMASRTEPVWLQETSVKSEKKLTSAQSSVQSSAQPFKQIKIGKEETQSLVNNSAEIIDLNAKQESRNRVHFSIDEPSAVDSNGVSLESPLYKFKKILPPLTQDVKEENDYTRMSNKMDEINRKLDYLIGALNNINHGQVPNDQTHLRDLSSIHKV